MRLVELARLDSSSEIRGTPDVVINDGTCDSRAATRGSVFFCVLGEHTDGHRYTADAAQRGASAFVVERWVDSDLPQLRVSSVRHAIGPFSSAIFGHPSASMTIVGVTGTNGKTTTTYMLEGAFASAGYSTGLAGTVEIHIAGRVHPVVHTTPEAPELQRTLAHMRDAGAGAVAMEVSSHGLSLHRVDGTRFACAVFTNLTRDHLDFHATMEEYEAAKKRLFTPELAERGVVNIDDPVGARWSADAKIPCVSYGFAETAQIRAVDVDLSRAGSLFTCVTESDRIDVRVPIAGRYNVSNALAALATFHVLDLPLEAAARGIESLSGVPGRLEAISAGQDFTVVVDYAHTPDSLENVLGAAREISEGSVVVVFGCGGDRDRGKRPLMGRVATALADRTVITSDNPRSEDPLAILAEIERGAKEGDGTYEIEPDRRAAIRRALQLARSGDVVVIAGKGHETGQRFADHVLPFDDRLVAREELVVLGTGR